MTSLGIINSSVILKSTFPLGLRKPKGKWIPFSGSWYRNAHHHESNKMKIHYTELAAKQFENVSPINDAVYSLFVLYKPNARRLDLDNYTTVHKKFFHDALVVHKLIKDDDAYSIPLQVSVYGGIDKENPRVDIYLSADINNLINIIEKCLCLKCP